MATPEMKQKYPNLIEITSILPTKSAVDIVEMVRSTFRDAQFSQGCLEGESSKLTERELEEGLQNHALLEKRLGRRNAHRLEDRKKHIRLYLPQMLLALEGDCYIEKKSSSNVYTFNNSR